MGYLDGIKEKMNEAQKEGRLHTAVHTAHGRGSRRLDGCIGFVLTA